MAIYIKTVNPEKLFESIKAKINELVNPSWKIDSEGDLVYTGYSYNDEAWLRPHFIVKNLCFGIIGNKNKTMSKYTYALYHTEIANFILKHFDDDIISIRITPQKVENIDKFN